MWVITSNNITSTRILFMVVAGILVVSGFFLSPSPTHAISCSTQPSNPWGGGYLLSPGATYNIVIPGWDYCITNSSGYYYFMPVNSTSEHDAFRNAVPYIAGLTIAVNDAGPGGGGNINSPY